MSAPDPIDTRTYPLSHEPIEDRQRIDPAASASEDAGGDATTAFAALGVIGGADYGLWEMSAGAMRDIEGDEVFLVLSGTGHIDVDHPERRHIDLGPGALVRLEDGMRTRWYVDKAPLRKLFIAPSED